MLLPDDDEDPRTHDWDWLVELVALHGITVTADQLMRLPYRVEFGNKLQARLEAS